MVSITKSVRVVVGSLSTLLSLLMLGLIQRQFSMWTATQEGYYLLSTGLFVVVLVILLVGVSWGLKTGEAAEKIWRATAGVISSIVSFTAAYYLFTGFVLDGGVNSIYSAMVSVATMAAVLMIFFFVLGVSKTK